MRKTKLKKLLIIILVVFFFLLGNSSFAQQRQFEIEYPEIPGAPLEETASPHKLLPQYILYLFYFGMAIVFLAVFGSLVFGGVLYIISAGKPELKRKAKDQIFAAFSGLIIMLTSYLIITTINPQLKFLSVLELEPIEEPLPEETTVPGIHFYEIEDCRGEKLFHTQTNSSDLGDLAYQVKSLRIVNSLSVLYGVIPFKEKGLRGNCLYYINEGCHNISPPVFSIIVFEKGGTGEKVVFYHESFYKEEGGVFEVKNSEVGELYQNDFWVFQPFAGWMFVGAPKFENIPEKGCLCEDLQIDNTQENCYYKNYDYKKCDCSVRGFIKGSPEDDYCVAWKRPTLAKEGISSIKINGDYVVKISSFFGCQVFPLEQDINKEGPKQIKWEYIRGVSPATGDDRYPTSITIFPGSINY